MIIIKSISLYKRKEREKREMKRLYDYLEKYFSEKEIKNNFNKKFLELSYQENNNSIHLYINEEYHISDIKIQSRNEYIYIYELDDEELNDYIDIFKINSIIYDYDDKSENLLNERILFFLKDIINIRYENILND